MREFTEALKNILKAASGYIQFLPAIGGAQEELTRTDDTERDDRWP